MKLENLFKKLHNKKGLTGTDVAISIIVIVLTVGIVASIYVNTTNKSKDQLRYSAATRIATQVMENIQSMTYQEVYDSIGDGASVDIDHGDTDSILGVKVLQGYGVTITSKTVNEDLDIVRDITVEVTYKLSTSSKSITLSTVKQLELPEQTNEPDISLLENELSSGYYYPVKLSGTSYVVTATSDPDWYNYDSNKFATIVVYSIDPGYSIGDKVSTSGATLYYWIPRYAIVDSEAVFCYGTSDKIIKYGEISSDLYGYYVSSDTVSEYVSDGFATNDAITGMWVSDASSTLYITLYSATIKHYTE